MKFVLKVFGIAVLLAALFMLTFELWGEKFETLFNQEACVEYFSSIRAWAWAVAIGLLLVDLLLPVPATGVMAALGSVYGPVIGTIVGVLGSAMAGFLGYGLARFGGQPVAQRIASDEELDQFQSFFDRWGGIAIIASRILPILPEVIAVLAGLARMRLRRFTVALLLGTVPTAALFAWVGHASRSKPWYGMAISIAIPLIIWPIFLHFMRKEPSPAP